MVQPIQLASYSFNKISEELLHECVYIFGGFAADLVKYLFRFTDCLSVVTAGSLFFWSHLIWVWWPWKKKTFDSSFSKLLYRPFNSNHFHQRNPFLKFLGFFERKSGIDFFRHVTKSGRRQTNWGFDISNLYLMKK